jgi:hypothetical protein
MDKRDLLADKAICETVLNNPCFAVTLGCGQPVNAANSQTILNAVRLIIDIAPHAIDRAIAAEQRVETLEGLLRKAGDALATVRETSSRSADGCGFEDYIVADLDKCRAAADAIEQALQGGDGK